MTKTATYDQILCKIEANYCPVHLELVNESHTHNVPENSETHFKLVLVSEHFKGLRPVQRHQAVYKTLADELQNGVHALALHLFSSEEWRVREGEVAQSPNCLGGGKKA